MKIKNLFLYSLLFFIFFAAPHTSQAQFTTPGCYISNNGIYSRVGDLNASGGCSQGSPLGAGGIPGQVVNNNLSYTRLEPLPGQNPGNTNFCDLLSFIFKLLIYLGGMLAVVYLVLGGISYMVSEVVDKRSLARDRIKAAIWGLIILLCSWIILNTINPRLVNACGALNATTTGVYYPPAPVTTVQSLRTDCTTNKGGALVTYTVNNIACAGTATAGQVNAPRAIFESRAPSGYNNCMYVGPGELCYYP